MFRSIAELLDVVPGHDILRFLAHQDGSLPQRKGDPQTRWTVLDPKSAGEVVGALDSLFRACEQSVEALAVRVSFGADRLDAATLLGALRHALESADSAGIAGNDDDGDTADSVFAVLIGLRALLQRARVTRHHVAVFTWAPA